MRQFQWIRTTINSWNKSLIWVGSQMCFWILPTAVCESFEDQSARRLKLLSPKKEMILNSNESSVIPVSLPVTCQYDNVANLHMVFIGWPSAMSTLNNIKHCIVAETWKSLCCQHVKKTLFSDLPLNALPKEEDSCWNW